MTRWQYACYLARRVGEALLVCAFAAYAVHLAQSFGWLKPADHRWALKLWYQAGNMVSTVNAPHKTPLFRLIEWWTFPVLVIPLAHLFFGPKQDRPIYLKKRGIMYNYGGVDVDHNSGCRGALILGATGSGKTQICINPRNHSIFINNGGVENRDWKGSEAAREFDGLRHDFVRETNNIYKEIKKLVDAREEIQTRLNPIQNAIVSALLVSVRQYQRENLHATFSQPVYAGIPQHMQVRFASDKLPLTPADIIGLFAWARKAQRFHEVSGLPFIPGALGAKLKEYAKLIEEDAMVDAAIGKLYYLVQVKRADLQRFSDTINGLRFKIPPVGMLVLGAKGNEWQNVVPLLHTYNRDESLCLLQTRPVGAPDDWVPPAKFNLIGYESFPADTFAKLICDTSAAVTGNTDQDFFSTQARDAIGNGIRLMRAIRDCQVARGIPAKQRLTPNLATLAGFMTSLPAYKEFMTELGASPVEHESEQMKRDPDTGITQLTRVKKIIAATLDSDDLLNARAKLEQAYWGLPDETRGGVMGNIRNAISPFTEPDVAEVFCTESTFDIAELCSGKVICVAMPQLYAVQRMYVGTIMKTLALQIGLNIFDLRRDDPLYANRNVVMIDSDEHQVSAGQEDQQVDRTREAQFTLYAATQTRSALYLRYGGKEKATPVISNLRNLFICQSGNDDCAEESVKSIGEVTQPETSFSSGGKGGGSNTSYREKPLIPKGALKALPPFYVVWCPAEGKWLYRMLIVMPVSPDGKTPVWWFGHWNPLHWVATILHLPPSFKIGGMKITLRPDTLIWPWRARAPFRAQRRYILGLDGTFIRLQGMTRKKAMKMALNSPGAKG